MSKHRKIGLSSEQRTTLEKQIRSGQTAARSQTRARILLLSDQSHGQYYTAEQIAEALLCSEGTVANVRKRFLEEGLESALRERPRPGAVRKVTGEIEAQLTLLACSDPPAGAGRWTLRLLAEQMVALDYIESLSHVTVGEVLKKTNCSRGG